MKENNLRQVKIMKGGWKGKTQALYTFNVDLNQFTAKDIFGDKPLMPHQIVKKAWDFVKAHSTKSLVKTS